MGNPNRGSQLKFFFDFHFSTEVHLAPVGSPETHRSKGLCGAVKIINSAAPDNRTAFQTRHDVGQRREKGLDPF